MGIFRDREVACSASDRQGWNLESCVFFILYISEVMDFEYAKQIIYKKPLDMCLKTIRYIVSRYSNEFSRFEWKDLHT